MKTVIPLLMLVAASPAGGDAALRFELRSQFTPLPEASAGRFALHSQLQPGTDSGRSAGADRFSLKAAPKGPASACADILFRDGFE